MDYSVGLAQSQRVIKQRNMLGIVALVLAGLVVLLFLVGATRDREIVLQPIVRTPLTLSSSGVSRDYLEMVTRDTALMTLNRSPENLQYWMDSILAIATPESHGALKRDLMKIVNEQNGSTISQYFTRIRQSKAQVTVRHPRKIELCATTVSTFIRRSAMIGRFRRLFPSKLVTSKRVRSSCSPAMRDR